MALFTPSITLSNGVEMPSLGLGVSNYGGHCQESVIFALKNCKYTLFDTAAFYGTEKYVAEAIETCGVKRSDLFITTKIFPSSYGFESTKRSLSCSLANLNTDYVDLYLMHWPDAPSSSFEDPKEGLKETWLSMEELYKGGKCRAIGVSNHLQEHLEEIFNYCSVKPHVNQIEFHPYNYPETLVEFCEEHHIVIEGYSPLCRGKILSNENLRLPIELIAKQHNKSPAQVLIRWSLQHKVVTIPKSTKVNRIAENIDVFDFELSSNDMLTLDSLSDKAHLSATMFTPTDLAAAKPYLDKVVRDESMY